MKKASTPMRIFIPVLVPFEGVVEAEGLTGATGAAGWVAPHLVQNLAPSARGLPQLTQNAAIGTPPRQARNVTKLLGARQER